jgi:hypothetical protein
VLRLDQCCSSRVTNANCAAESTDEELRLNLATLVTYAQGTNIELQRLVAEKLANEAVISESVRPSVRSRVGDSFSAEERRERIVGAGALKLLVPLTESSDVEVKRLAAHALANLSVDGEST